MKNKNIFKKEKKPAIIENLYLLGRVFLTLNKKQMNIVQLLKQNIKGIGMTHSANLGAFQGLNISKKLDSCDLSEEQLQKRLNFMEKTLELEYVIDKTLDRSVEINVDKKFKSGMVKGQLIKLGLPSRGQRTKTNAKTSKNRRKASLLAENSSKKTNKKDKKNKKKDKK
jgi:small subunit ribosomal protein S13